MPDLGRIEVLYVHVVTCKLHGVQLVCYRQQVTMSQLARPLQQVLASVRQARLLSTASVLQSNDPIQKLFVDKLRQYGEKSK